MLKTRFFSICIFLCVILSINSINASDYFSYALRLFSEKQYYSASLEFERAVYHETDNIRTAYYKYYKSLCFKNLDQNKKAIEELNNINLYRLPDSLLYKIQYELAYCNFLNNEPNKSIWNIEELRIRFPDSLTTKEIIPLNILCLNAVGKFEEARNLWNYYLENNDLQDSLKGLFYNEIKSLYHNKNLPGIYSPETAQNLSRFIPGSGQIYCGEILEGSFNFFMNAAILSFSIYEFYTGYYLTGYFVGLGLLNKTYNGGLHRAKLLAVEKNKEEIRKFNEEASLLMLRIGKDHGQYSMGHKKQNQSSML